MINDHAIVEFPIKPILDYNKMVPSIVTNAELIRLDFKDGI